MQQQTRQIAHIVRIPDIANKKYVEQEGWLPNYVVSDWGEQISRINLIGTIVDIQDQQILLDDGFGTLPLRTFDEIPAFSTIEIGKTVCCIGRIRVYNNEYYIIVEAIQPIASEFVQVRHKQLEIFDKMRTTKQQANLDTIEKEIAVDTELDNPLLVFIEQKDEGQGVSLDDIYEKFPESKEQVEQLMMNGDVFEIQPGVLKVLK